MQFTSTLRCLYFFQKSSPLYILFSIKPFPLFQASKSPSLPHALPISLLGDHLRSHTPNLRPVFLT